jgi:fused signal recognition particle receptor
MGFFDKLKLGMSKTKESLNEKINDVFSNFKKIDEDLIEELEEILILSDIGMNTALKITEKLRQRIKKENIKDETEVKKILKEEIINILEFEKEEQSLKLTTKPSVILIVGVNGVRKNYINR